MVRAFSARDGSLDGGRVAAGIGPGPSPPAHPSRTFDMQRKFPITLGLVAASLGFVACSGGSSSEPAAIHGLEGPSQMSVVTADNDTGGGGGSGSSGDGENAPGASNYPPNSDYVLDDAELHVYDPSMESLGTINMILCLTSMTAYSQMVNGGLYTALIDEALCGGGEEADTTQGQSSGGIGDLALYTVRASRSAANADQLVSIWVPNADPPPGVGDTIYAQMAISRGVSSANPFGEFDMVFAGPTSHGDMDTDPGMHGGLRTIPAQTGDIGFQFFEEFGDVDVAHTPGQQSHRGAITVEMNDAQTEGAARVYQAQRYDFGGGDSGKLESEWEVVFDETHVKRREIVGVTPGPTVTLSREDFNDQVWRYNLYHATGGDIGERVDLESGFGFRTQSGEYGWIGYWGLWVPDGVVVLDGDTVIRDDSSAQDGDAYTLKMAPGKLIRNTREAMTLADLAGQLLEWWEAGNQFRVDHDGSDFRRVQQWNNGTGSWDDITPPTIIDVTAAGGFLNLWSGSLGGPVSYVDGDAEVTYFQQEFINGSDALMFDAVGGHVALYGLVQCLDSNISTASAEAGSVYLADAPDTTPANAHLFQFGVDDLTLFHDPVQDKSTLNQVGLGAGQEPTTGPYTWGMRTGPLVQDLAGLTDVWDIWNVNEFFVYETGHNAWNQLTTVEDAFSADVVFDAPLQFLYEHLTANDLNEDASHDGHKVVLQYGGPGDLWGIPSEGVDLTGDAQPDRWYPVFSIADGVICGPTGTEYVIRGIEVERTLDEDPGGAPDLDITDAGALTLPDNSLYSTPVMGPRPVVQAPPAVINGELVD